MANLLTRQNYVLIGSDFSAQEVRMTAFLTQDKGMIKAYVDGKDLYSAVASNMYDNAYEENLEFYPEGTEIDFEGQHIVCGYKTHLNKEGKARRQSAKAVLIGILYGRGVASIAEQTHKTRAEAQDIVDRFFRAYPTVKQWIDQTHADAHRIGYVEDWYGRRRRLPDIQLPRFEVSFKNPDRLSGEFNPFINCNNRIDENNQKILEHYLKALEKGKSLKEYEQTRAEAERAGLIVKNNQGFIAQAERQSVNARVQGGSATLTKLAMINIDKDPRLKELGFELLITVHDEVIGQCPEGNAEQVAELLPQLMIDTAAQYINVPFKCDPYIVKRWYDDEQQNALEEEYKKYVKGDPDKGKAPMSEIDAYNKLLSEHEEMLESEIKNIVEGLGVHNLTRDFADRADYTLLDMEAPVEDDEEVPESEENIEE